MKLWKGRRAFMCTGFDPEMWWKGLVTIWYSAMWEIPWNTASGTGFMLQPNHMMHGAFHSLRSIGSLINACPYQPATIAWPEACWKGCGRRSIHTAYAFPSLSIPAGCTHLWQWYPKISTSGRTLSSMTPSTRVTRPMLIKWPTTLLYKPAWGSEMLCLSW